jgi:hypothetical protein
VTERKKILLRLDPAVHDALARWAGDELRSTTAQIEYLLRQALAQGGRLPGNVGGLPRRGRPRKDAAPSEEAPSGSAPPEGGDLEGGDPGVPVELPEDDGHFGLESDPVPGRTADLPPDRDPEGDVS